MTSLLFHSRRTLLVAFIMLFASASYGIEGVTSVSVSPATVNVNSSVTAVASLATPGVEVGGTVVILFHLPNGTVESVSQTMSGTCPSSVTKTYTPTVPGAYTVDAIFSGWYRPQGSPYPIGFDGNACDPKNLTVNPSQSSGQPGTSPLGTTVPAGWTDLVAGDSTNANSVGSTVGELAVGGAGEATYSIPLWTTPGSSGMQPEISLNYSSQGGNGLLGQGWSLGGLTAITRGPQTQAVDGIVKGVDFSATDRFYLDGQRLRVISGTYGAANSEYRTHLESFSKVVAKGTAGSGPAWFEVKTKSGLTIEYGNGLGSARNAYGRPETMSWHVNKITDAAGNYMSFTYDFLGSAGEHYITRIDYTGNASASLTPYASLRFEYESRADTTVGYVYGVKVATNKRLKRIRSYYGSNIVRTYELSYINTGSASRSQLSILYEIGQDGVRYNGMVFGYSGGSLDSAGWSSSSSMAPPVPMTRDDKTNGTGFMDVNGDGYPDFVYARSGLANQTWLNSPTGWGSPVLAWALPSNAKLADADGKDQGARFVDFNGDGRVDLMVGNGGSTTYAYRNTGSGWVYDSGWNIPTFIRGTADPDEAQRHFLDINGDGRVDFIFNNDADNNNNSSYKGAYINTGSGWSYSSGWTPPLKNTWKQHAIFIDVNGDGLPDQVAHQNDDRTQYGVALNTGSGWNLYTSGTVYSRYLPPLPIARFHDPFVGSNKLDIYGVEVVDMNGDGLSDLVYADNFASSTFRTYLNTGYGWVEDTAFRSQIQFGERGPNRGAAVVDLNGDGLPDLTTFEGTSTSYKKTQYNRGNSVGSVQTYSGLSRQMDEYVGSSYRGSGAQLVDLDADGFVDQPYNRGNSSGSSVASGAYINTVSEPRHLLKTVTNGLGVVARIEYAPITERSALNSYTFYKVGDGDTNGDGVVNSGDLPLPNTVSNVIGPMYVVKKLKHEDGAGAGALYEVNYSYKGLRSDRLYGSVGFQEISVLDTRTEMASTATSSQAWPHVGTPVASKVVYKPGSTNRTIAKSASTLSTAYYNSNKTVVPYVSVSTETSYDPENGSTVLKKVKTTTGQLDSYGNVGFVEVDTTGADGKTHRKSTVSAYYNNATDWHLGRLLESTTETYYWNTVTNSYKTDSRTSEWAYYSATDIANGKIKGMLWYEIIDPDAYDASTLGPLFDNPAYLFTSYKYDVFGNVIRKDLLAQGISGRYSLSDYDSKGRLLDWTRNAKGHQTTYTSQNQYFGKPLIVTDPNGLQVTTEYDGFGRVKKVTAPDGVVSETRRRWSGWAAPSAAEYLVETETKGSPPSVEFFDKYGRAIEAYAVNPGDNGVAKIVGGRTDYDSQSRPYRKYDAFFYGATPVLAQETLYDAYGRVEQVKLRKDQAGAWGVTSYDYVGLTTRSTNPKGQRTDTTVDYQGNKTQIVSNATGSGSEKGDVRYDYDGYGQLLRTRVYNDNGAVATTSFTYDSRGRKVSMTDPDMGTWSYVYNGVGELVSQTDARGKTTSMIYDELGRLKHRDTPEFQAGSWATVRTTWHWDQVPWTTRYGLLHAVGVGAVNRVDGNGSAYSKTYTRHQHYDSLSRPVKRTDIINGTVYYTQQSYDALSRPLVKTYHDGFKVRHLYNAYGFLHQVKEDGGSGTVYWDAKTYDVRGNLTRFDMGNGLNVRYGFENYTGRLKTIDSGSGTSSSVMNLDYTYDALGNVMSRYVTSGNDYEFEYDGLNRMTFAGYWGIGGANYSYDALGNIKTKAGVAGTYTYDATKLHAVTQAGGYGYTYDANGNREYKKSGTNAIQSMAWSGNNKLWRIVNGSGLSGASPTVSQQALFWMDESGQRVIHMDSQNGTTYYIDGGNYEIVWDAYNATSHYRIKRYVNTPSGRTAVRTSYHGGQWSGLTKTRYMHQDSLGSVYAVTTENGTVEQSMTYDPWGKQTVTDNSGSTRPKPDVDRGYTDHEMMTDYGLIHMNGRVYDYTLGRFCSADPFVQDASDSQAYNRMSYVGNNPMTYSDPSGYFSLKDALKIVAVVVISVVTAGAALAAISTSVTGVFGASGALAVMAGTHATLALTGVGAAFVGGVAGFAGSFASTLLNGGSIGDAFKAGFKGGVIGAISGGLANRIGSTSWGTPGKALAHGALQGSLTVAQGGEFHHGFLAGFASKVTAQPIQDSVQGPVAQTIAAAVVGGTASQIGGGKFANGAVSGAFTYLFNQVATGSDRRVSVAIVDSEDEGGLPGDGLANGADLLAAAKKGGFDHIIEARSAREAIAKMRALGIGSGSVGRLQFFDHGQGADSVSHSDFQQTLGDSAVSLSDFRRFANYLTSDATVVLGGCYAGCNRGFIMNISSKLPGRSIWAYSDIVYYNDSKMPWMDPGNNGWFGIKDGGYAQ